MFLGHLSVMSSYLRQTTPLPPLDWPMKKLIITLLYPTKISCTLYLRSGEVKIFMKRGSINISETEINAQ